MPSRVSNVSEMATEFNQWVVQLTPTSMDDRYFVANDELANCFLHHNAKWDTAESRKDLLEVLHSWHPAGIQPICAKTWQKISCPTESFKNGH